MIPAKVARRLGLAALAVLALIVLPGCEPDPYPADLNYPFRTDLLIETAKGRDIPEENRIRPGDLDNFLRGLKELAVKKPAEFKVADPAELSDEQRKPLRTVLRETFGSPSAPRIFFAEDELQEPDLIAKLQLDGPTLVKGSILYRRHCLHCHGLAGDGHGPTAPWINPPPRDFRRGAFKFSSVENSPLKMKPLRSDLVRTLTEGIEGTAMPNFRYLPEDDKNALVSYVMHLSIRGATEFGAIVETLAGSKLSQKPDVLVKELMNSALKEWRDSAVPLPVVEYPKEYEEPAGFAKSVGDGYQLFIGKAGCLQCHVDFGRQSQYIYDMWGTLVKPNNLTNGVFRGGRRPIDIYYRLRGGIEPSTMPYVPKDIADNPKDMWALVNFVRSLPFEKMLPQNYKTAQGTTLDVHKAIYGPSGRLAVSKETKP